MVYGPLAVAKAGILTAVLTFTGGNNDPAVVAIRGGAECASSTSASCALINGTGTTSATVTAGQYWIVVSNRGAGIPGPFTLWVGFQ